MPTSAEQKALILISNLPIKFSTQVSPISSCFISNRFVIFQAEYPWVFWYMAIQSPSSQSYLTERELGSPKRQSNENRTSLLGSFNNVIYQLSFLHWVERKEMVWNHFASNSLWTNISLTSPQGSCGHSTIGSSPKCTWWPNTIRRQLRSPPFL